MKQDTKLLENALLQRKHPFIYFHVLKIDSSLAWNSSQLRQNLLYSKPSYMRLMYLSML